MPVIYETDEDKYYDKEDIKKFKKGAQTGIESRGSGMFLPGTKQGYGLYLPRRVNYEGEGLEGEGIIDSIISVGKTVIEGLANNAGTIGQAASAVGSIAGATANVADAVKSIKNAHSNNKLAEWKAKNKERLDTLAGESFKYT